MAINKSITMYSNGLGGSQSWPLTRPTGVPTLSVSAISTTALRISVVSVYPVDLEWSADGSTNWTSLASGIRGSFDHDGLAPNTTRYYRGKERNSLGSADDYSTTASGATPLTLIPSPSGISGSYVQDSTMTISGSSFTALRNGQLEWEDFESYTVGQLAVDQMPDSFDDGGPGTSARYYVSNTQSYTGTKSLGARANGVSINGLRWKNSIGFTSVLVSFLYRITYHSEPPVTGGEGHQLKLTRFVGTTTDSHTTAPFFGATLEKVDNIHRLATTKGRSNPYPGGQGDYPSSSGPVTDNDITSGVWQRYTHYIKVSDFNQTNGKLFACASNFGIPYHSDSNSYISSSNPNYNQKSWGMEDICTRSYGAETTIKQHMFSFYKRASSDYEIYLDGIFVNDSFESVWFGDAAQWINCTEDKKMLQPMLSRTNNSIQIKAQVGPLVTGPVYAYIFNADGTYNPNGLLVRAS